MGWGFRKRIKIAPGITLNFSKSGISTTIGKRGASMNFGRRGSFLNLSIPGTGIYMRQRISSGGTKYGKSDLNENKQKSDYHPRYGCGWFGCFAVLAIFFVFVSIIMKLTGEDIKDGSGLLGMCIAYLLFYYAKDIYRFIKWMIKKIFGSKKRTTDLEIIDSNSKEKEANKEADSLVYNPDLTLIEYSKRKSNKDRESDLKEKADNK